MEIVSVETTHVTEQPFAGLVEIDDFAPYYQTTIRYQTPREGERVDRVYSVTGTGASEFASEQAAMENLKGMLAVEAYTAMEHYNAAHGAGNLDIA